MPGADQHHQLHSSSSHHERTYILSSQECEEQIMTISFIPAPATMSQLTSCQAKNARSTSTPSASCKLQPSRENYQLSRQSGSQEQINTISFIPAPATTRNLTCCEKPRIPRADEHYQLHSSTSQHERTYILSSQECQQQINTISFIPVPP
jgi:hypothetical protein